jgi:hypothetical protein
MNSPEWVLSVPEQTQSVQSERIDRLEQRLQTVEDELRNLLSDSARIKFSE